MFSTQVAGTLSIALSMGAMLGMLLFVPALWQKMANIQNKLQVKMDEFNAVAGDAWKEIVILRAQAPKQRQARQANSVCRKLIRSAQPWPDQQTFVPECNEKNTCPPGAAGEPGDAGPDGWVPFVALVTSEWTVAFHASIPGNQGKPGIKGDKGRVYRPPKEVSKGENRQFS